ncbi:hypothetical protein COOONC_13615 [Cooperia oncophora]
MLDPEITTFGNKLPAHTMHVKLKKEKAAEWFHLQMKAPDLWTAPPCFGICLKWSDYQLMVEQTYRTCETLVDDANMMQALRESKFDLVYSEGLDTCGPGLFEMLNIKSAVILCSLGMWPRLYDISGLRPLPSFVPIGLSPFSDELSFFERLINFQSTYLLRYL